MLKIDFLQYETELMCDNIFHALLLWCHQKWAFSKSFTRFLFVLYYICTRHFVMFDFRYFLCSWRGKGRTYHREILPQSQGKKEIGEVKMPVPVLFSVEVYFHPSHRLLPSNPRPQRQRLDIVDSFHWNECICSINSVLIAVLILNLC